MDILKDVVVLDDFIPEIIVDECYRYITNNRLDWYYTGNISGIYENVHEMFHGYSGFANHDWHPLGNIILQYVINKVGLPSNPTVKRMRRCLTQRTYTKVNTISPMHIDLECPHMTIVYYANDNDGETIIFDKLATNFNELDHMNPPPVLQRVQSKRGRAVLFNGLYQHSGSLSSDADRFFLNINFNYE